MAAAFYIASIGALHGIKTLWRMLISISTINQKKKAGYPALDLNNND